VCSLVVDHPNNTTTQDISITTETPDVCSLVVDHPNTTTIQDISFTTETSYMCSLVVDHSNTTTTQDISFNTETLYMCSLVVDDPNTTTTQDISFITEALDMWAQKFLTMIDLNYIIMISFIFCIVILSSITILLMNNGQNKWGFADEWPWLNPDGGAKNMPGPYTYGPDRRRPKNLGPERPKNPTVEPKRSGPKGPSSSKPNFGDPGLSKKN
jgi:hypothetical protein